MKRMNKSLAVALIGGGSLGAFGGAVLFHNTSAAQAEQQQVANQQQVSHLEDMATVFRDVGKSVEPSVVQIQVRKTVKGLKGMPLPDDMLRRFFPDQGQGGQGDQGDDNAPDDGGGGAFEQVGTGSGSIMEVNGKTAYILTNNHVAGGASEMTVTLADGRKIDNAKLVGADPKTDLAVVKIEADNLKAAKWGDSSSLQQGDWIMAFGSPFGYVGSMTHGIVSALDRTGVGILGQQGYEDFIQVDAPINPGNSGGPLVNLHGEVVGVNTAIASHTGGFQGIGFAIPVNEAKFVYNQLKEHGKVTRGWLGVAIADVGRNLPEAKALGYTGENGVLVEQTFENTPATGKLQPGDVITSINGKPTGTVTQLRNQIAAEAPNSEVKLSVFRDGKDHDVTIKLGEQPENLLAMARGPAGQAHAGNGATAEALGMRLADPDQQLSEKYGLDANQQGAVVTMVAPRSSAARAGIRPGDMITRVGAKTVHSAKEASDLIAKNGKTAVLLYVTNTEGSRFISVQPPAK